MNHLMKIIKTLSEFDVDFIICGGVALVLHGIERLTMDLDISIDFRKDNVEKFLKAMKKMGLVPRAPVPAECLLDPVERERIITEKNALVFTFIDVNNPYKQVDVFLIKNLSYDLLKNDIEEIEINKYKIKVVSKNMLLKLKKAIYPLRDKDTFDIQCLEKMAADSNITN